MGRPPNTDPAVTRGRILNAAVTAFGASGRDGTSIREVARRSGVSMSTVLHHYGTKDGLFEACLELLVDAVEAHRAQIGVTLSGVTKADDAVQQLVATTVDFIQRQRRLVRLVLSERATTGRTPPSVFARALAPTLDALAPWIVARSGRSDAEARLAVLSALHLALHHLLTAPEELAQALGVTLAEEAPEALPAALVSAVEGHIVAVVSRLVQAPA